MGHLRDVHNGPDRISVATHDHDDLCLLGVDNTNRPVHQCYHRHTICFVNTKGANCIGAVDEICNSRHFNDSAIAFPSTQRAVITASNPTTNVVVPPNASH